ncbi:hypothetical protein V493_01175, partial [Pseudogymnoascus sp. VKM F-4281 (FW-2241)]
MLLRAVEKAKQLGRTQEPEQRILETVLCLISNCVILLRQWSESIVAWFDMAAPLTKTLNDLDGMWTLNKRLSDDFDEVLTLQGIGWILRKAIGMASTTEQISQSKDEHGVEHITIHQTITGGIKTTPEHRVHTDTWG